MVKIAVLASFNMDLVMGTERRPGAGETLQGEFAMHLGGKGFNQAVAARRLGAEVVVTGRVGDDEFGRMFLDALDREGIDRRAVIVDADVGTGVASIIVEADGTNTIVQSPRANRRVTREQIEEHAGYLFEGTDMAMLQLETSMEGAAAFVTNARERAVTVTLNPAPASVDGRALVAQADIVITNEIEAEAIGYGPIHGGRETMLAAKAGAIDRRSAVITLGGEGVVGSDGIETIYIAALEVDAVDTVGAGDAFCAAFAVRGAENNADLRDALRFANAAGALACTKHGAEPSMPYRDEVEALLMAQGGRR